MVVRGSACEAAGSAAPHGLGFTVDDLDLLSGQPPSFARQLSHGIRRPVQRDLRIRGQAHAADRGQVARDDDESGGEHGRQDGRDFLAAAPDQPTVAADQ
jgi:hypothetical protein